MSKTKRTKSARKGSKVKSTPKSIKHKLFCVVPIKQSTDVDSLLDYFKQTNYPATLVLVGETDIHEESESIKFINRTWTYEQEAFKLGFEATESEDGFWSFIYQDQIPLLLAATTWFYSKKINATEKVALIGSFGESKGINNWVHHVWSPVQAKKPLANINICSKDVAKSILDESITYMLPIEQTRLIRSFSDINQIEMELQEAPSQSFVGLKFKLINQNLQLLLQDFVISPILSIKRSSSVVADLKNGNHPLYRLSFALIFVFFLFLMPILSFDYGITWDEPVNVEYAEDIYNYYKTGGEDQMVFNLQERHARNATMHYGASFDFFAFLVQKISPFNVYETRHLLNALVGVLIALFVGRIGKELGNWRLATIALVFVLLSPRFFGHSMNNHKDIPFMLGYAMGIYYLIRFCRQLPQPRLSTMFWLSIGMAYGISIRIGGLLFIAYFVMFFGLSWLIQAFQKSKVAFKVLPKYLAYGVGIVLASYLLGIVLWPYGFEAPFSNPFKSLSHFTNFKFLTSYEVFDGKRILMENPPSNYIPKWIWISTPIVVLVGLIMSVPHLLHQFKKLDKFVLFLLFFTAIFPVAYVIYKHSTLYSGWRHVLFIYAPLVVLAAFGWEYLFQLSPKKWVNAVVTIACIGLLALPTAWSVKNHPNQYVYFNELIGGINGAYTNYETEYWPNAVRQAIEWVLENEPVRDKKTVIATNFEVNASQYYANKVTDSVQIVWVRENQKYKSKWDYALFGSRTLSKTAIQNTYPPAGTIHTIKADTVPLVAIIKQDENNSLYKAYKSQERGKLKEAMQFVDEALTYDPKNLEAIRLKGTLLLNYRKYDEAVVQLQKAIDLSPEDYSAYTLIGAAYRMQKKHEEALNVLQTSVNLRVNNAGGYHQMALVYADRKDWQRAYQNFDKSLRHSNYKNANMIFDVSRIQIQHAQARKDPKDKKFRENRYKAAINNLKQVLKLRPNDRRAINNIAFAYLHLGDTATYKMYAAQLRKK